MAISDEQALDQKAKKPSATQSLLVLPIQSIPTLCQFGISVYRQISPDHDCLSVRNHITGCIMLRKPGDPEYLMFENNIAVEIK